MASAEADDPLLRDLHRRLDELKAVREAHERGTLDGLHGQSGPLLPGSRYQDQMAIKTEIDEVLTMIARRLEELARA